MFSSLKKMLLTALFTVMSVTIQAQVIKGVVKDTDGNALPGVSVLLEGTSTGTVTGSDGSYQINVHNQAKGVLQFTMIGMKTVYQRTNGKSVIDVTLEEDTRFLDEVVVVGYQEVKRKDLLGAVTSVSSSKLVEQPVNTVGQALAGRMAGVSVVTTEGNPDPEMKIRIRGTGSITQSSDPLYIIDGFPADGLGDISASQIQSIDVLKDAFSTAIYGSRGANGVVIVTTKSAAGAGKVSVNFNAYYGSKVMANKDAYTPQNASEFVKSQYEMTMLRSLRLTNSYTSYFGTFEDLSLYDDLPVNDYVDMIFGNVATNYNADLSVSGRSKAVDWTMTLARLGENGIMTGSTYNRTNLGFKAKLRTGNKTSIDVNFRYSDANERGGAANNMNDLSFSAMNGRVNQALAFAPIPCHNNILGEEDDETFFEYMVHPLKSIRDNDQQTKRTWLNMNGAFNWTIIRNLRLKLDFGYGVNTTDKDQYMGPSTYWSNMRANAEAQGLPANRHFEFRSQRFRNANTLQYDFRNILDPDQHKLNVVVGQELTYYMSQNHTVVTEGFPDFFTAEDAWNFMASGTPYQNELIVNQDDVLLSFFGRANYTFLDRYSIGATVRADGSSKFGEGNRWGVFPSAAVSWDIANEPFLDNVSWIDQLKLRYSYGTAGNNSVPSGHIYPIYGAASTNNIDGINSVWVPGSSLPNPDLTWETAVTHNIGFDFSFLSGRVNGSLELYDNRTKDLIIRFPISGTGYKNQYQNRASIMNRGVEATLNLPIVQKRNFDLNISANVSYNVNKVLGIGGLDNIKSSTGWASSHIEYDYMITQGQPLGNVYGYEVDGIYQVEDFDYVDGVWKAKDGVVDSKDILGALYFRPGSVKIKDQPTVDTDGDEKPDAGDGKIDIDDMVKIGNTLPDITGGFSLNAYIYGVDISANFNYMIGNDVYNANRLTFTNNRHWSRVNMSDEVSLKHRWTAVDWNTGELFTDPAAYAEANKDATMWSPMMYKALALDYGVEDASFLRLQSLTIGYTFPSKWTDRIKMKKLRIYVSGTNLFCLTNYSGYDPEVDCRRSTPLTPGCDFSAYPKSIGGVVGINVGF